MVRYADDFVASEGADPEAAGVLHLLRVTVPPTRAGSCALARPAAVVSHLAPSKPEGQAVSHVVAYKAQTLVQPPDAEASSRDEETEEAGGACERTARPLPPAIKPA